MKEDKKFIVPSKLWSTCLSFGEANAVIPLTFFGHGWTPCDVVMRSKYSICCFLMKHLFGLNFSPVWYAFSTVSNRCMSWRSSVDPCTLMSSAFGNVPGMPARIRSMCSQKISDDADNPKGRCTKQCSTKACWTQWEAGFFHQAVWSSTRSWHLVWISADHSWSCAEHPPKMHYSKCCG